MKPRVRFWHNTNSHRTMVALQNPEQNMEVSMEMNLDELRAMRDDFDAGVRAVTEYEAGQVPGCGDGVSGD